MHITYTFKTMETSKPLDKGTVSSYRVFKQAKSINGGSGDNLILDLSRLDVIICRKYLMGDHRIFFQKNE